jgi:hypothetical protein
MKEENGPLIALVLFIVLSAVFGILAYNAHTEVIGGEDRKPKKAEIQECLRDISDVDAVIQQCRKDIARLAADIKLQDNQYNYYADLYDGFTQEYNRRERLLGVATDYDKKATDLTEQITRQKSETVTRVNKQTTEVREEMEREVQQCNTERDAATSKRNQLTEELEADKKKFQQNKNYTKTELDNSKSVLGDLTQRDIERANVLMEADGKVVLADPLTHTVVIDIGTAAGVKNGYRFEVYGLRPGNVKQSKGYIEVRRADPTKSECIVVRRPVVLPKDPLSDYVAKDPEEIYSPYQESGRKEGTAQPLSGRPKVAISGPSKLDPIVEGDVVQNPFFSPGKTFTYYIAGAKAADKKSAIRYRWTDIKTVVESYGDKVVAKVDPTVNYVIAQKNPEEGDDLEKAEFKKAKELGLPVIYEWELFRFLDTR